jgi:hypothetical protein
MLVALCKRVNPTDAFVQRRHWEWRAAIHILKILILSFLLLKLGLFK